MLQQEPGDQVNLQHTNCFGRRKEWPTVTDGLDLNGLGDPLLRADLRRLAAHLGLEQRVHQSGLAQAALPCVIDEHTQVVCLPLLPPQQKLASGVPTERASVQRGVYTRPGHLQDVRGAAGRPRGKIYRPHICLLSRENIPKRGFDSSKGGLKPLWGI